MGFILSGYVLRPARLASGNARSTGEATSGVSRDHIEGSIMSALGYDAAPSGLVEPYADMYRAGVLGRPEERSGAEEYIIWAATTGSLSTIDSEAFVIPGAPAAVQPSAGGLSAGSFNDGTETFFVEDEGGRDISSVKTLVMVRGDNAAFVSATTFASQDPLIGRVVLTAGDIGALDGGFSLERGDTIFGVSYILSGPKFWWSRNDSTAIRFGWDGKVARWAPLQGSTPQNMGSVSEEGGSYGMVPPVSRFSVGDTLPGIPGIPEAFALVRGGIYPDSSSLPLNVLVVSDTDAGEEYPTTGVPDPSTYDAVVGVTNGAVLLNPTYAGTNAGLTLWYNPESFRPDADGDMGVLADMPDDSPVGWPSMSPIPGPTDRPFVRIGFRRYLTPIAKDTDDDLNAPGLITERSFEWSRATGKIVLSKVDMDRATPGASLPTDDADYDILYLGARIYYDGVSLSTQPVPYREPAPCLNKDAEDLVGEEVPLGVGIGGGDLFIKRSAAMPPPGTSGVLFVPDGSGELPATSPAPQTRPNGSGLVRQLEGIGDTFVFASSKAFETLKVEEYAKDIPNLKSKVKRTEAVTSRMKADPQPPGYTDTSRVQIKRRKIRGEALYFIQAQVLPSVYSEEARLFSRYQEPYALAGTETLTFVIDGLPHIWSAPAEGTYSAADIAASLSADSTGAPPAARFEAIRGRVAIRAADLDTGTVEVGWNSAPDDLSGHSALGFLPGWRVDASDDTFRWQPDNGASIGIFRSPENLDRSAQVADVKAVGKFRTRVLTENLPGVPFFNLSHPPLEDIPGFDEGIHFIVAQGLNLVGLSNYGVNQGIGIKHEFENDRLVWTQRGSLPTTPVLASTDILQLPDQSVLPETVSSIAMAPTGADYGLYLKDIGDVGFPELLLGVDFLMPGDGAPGQAQLVTPEGAEIASGGGGVFTAGGPFSNPNFSPDPSQDLALQMDLLAKVEVGYRLLIINGEAEGQGLYTVTAKALVGGTAELTVDPPFPVDGSTVSWFIYEGQTLDVFDPTVIADVKQVTFNHFAQEPWKIRLLSSTGTVGGSLTAVVADARASNRIVNIRFGTSQPPAANGATVSFLQTGTLLGGIAATGLFIPDLTDPHFLLSTAPTPAFFQLRIGAELFNSTLGNLKMVGVNGTPPAAEIEVNSVTGAIRFGEDVLADFAGEAVLYDQLFLDPSLLSSGKAEINPDGGAVNLSASDLTAYAGEVAYFVEQMVTEATLDVVISPLNGSILFNKPLREFQLVESEYYQADTNGDIALDADGVEVKIVEYLPLIVRLEEATAITTSLYAFNPTGRTLGARGDEFVWVGALLQNFAGDVTATVNDDSTVTLASPVPAGDGVQINYGVLEAFGGETAYTVSTVPVYRKPFFLLEAQTTFALETDRTEDVSVGQMGVVGQTPFYIEAVSYDAGANETTVEIWPPPLTEIGSRAPGRDNGFTLTDIPVAITVDPNGSAVAGGGNAGFLLEISQVENPILPADVGQVEIVISGDLTLYTKTGHLLEIAGYPYVVVGSSLSEDGRFTNIGLANPVYEGHSSADRVFISVRPVYTPSPFEFAGISAFVPLEGFRLFLEGSADASGVVLPGRELAQDVHYSVDPGSGGVIFLAPSQGPLLPGESLISLYTAVDPIGPALVASAIVTPFYKSQYLYITLPSDLNRILGSTLAAKYTFRNPDTFYYEVLPVQNYLAEVAGVALSKVAGSSRSGGPSVGFPGTPKNSEQGALGLRGEIHNLKDQDRAARSYIELYNGVVLAFEQVLEVLDGRMIGDRDGKFRFFIGHGKRYAPPGYEDDITGQLVQRLVWRDIIDSWVLPKGTDFGYYTEDDPVYDPTTAEEKNPTTKPGETDGKSVNSHNLSFYTALQRTLVKNDMDDRVLVGMGRPRGLFGSIFPGINIPGEFKDMWEGHVFSRLFPERTKHFTRLFPGLEAVQDPATGGFTDPGYYSSGRKITTDGPEPGETTKSIIKTRGSPIGVVANPALGNILGVVDVTAQDRLPRARIWRYYPEGDADLDASLGLTDPPTAGKATFVATVLPLSEFPLKDDGFPDEAQLVSVGPGLLPDLASGDPDLSTPGFQVGQRVQFGVPSGPGGTSYELTDSKGNGIFIGAVQAGCVLTLVDRKENDVTGSDILVNEESALGDIVTDGTGLGDTVHVGQPIVDLDDLIGEDEAPTLEQTEELAQSLPDYRIQFDLKVAKRSGEFLDASLPTRDDVFPLPLQNMFGQKPPLPLTCIEGVVEFVNTARVPLKLPALLGLPNDDSGDVQIPYMQGGNDTELTLLGEVASQFSVLLGADSTVATPFFPPGGDPPEAQESPAILPDEIVFFDGTIWEVANSLQPAPNPDPDPATMYTARDLRPVSSGSTAEAIGDTRRFDLLLVEVGQALSGGDLNTGMTGILTVGEVTSNGLVNPDTLSKLEAPRFVSTAKRGSTHKYTATNAFGHLTSSWGLVPIGTSTDGVLVTEVIGAIVTTTLDFSTVGSVLLSNTTGALTGGVLALAPGNAVIINIYNPDPLAPAGTSYIGAFVISAIAPAGVVTVWDALLATSTPFTLDALGLGVRLTADDIIAIDTTGPTSLFTALSGALPGLFYDFTITIDTFIDPNTASISPLVAESGAGSSTCEISRDRLTFNERASFRTAQTRGLNPANLDPIEIGVQLNVQRITTSGTPDCDVNESAEVNGGVPFTLQTRIGPTADTDPSVPAGAPYVGTFVEGPVPSANGTLRVMSWEGNGNLPLPFSASPDPVTGIIVSAVPSSDLGETSVILNGDGTMRDAFPSSGTDTLDGTQNWIERHTGGAGSLANVLAGDIVVVDGGPVAGGEGAAKTGTYLCRHAIDTNVISTPASGSVPLLEGAYANDAGSRRVLDLTFPTVKSASSPTIVLENVPSIPNAPEGCGFESTGFLYLILKTKYSTFDPAGPAYTVDPESMYRQQYTAVSYDAGTGEATITLDTSGGATKQNATGGSITNAQFFAAAVRGLQVSGMSFFPIRPRADTGMPENNVVGFQADDTAGHDLTAGFRVVVAGNLNVANHGGNSGVTVETRTWDKVATPTDIEALLSVLDTVTGAGRPLGIRVPNALPSTMFYADREATIYGREYATGSFPGTPEVPIRGVADYLSIEALNNTDWTDIHFETFSSGITNGDHRIRCLYPRDRIMLGDDPAAVSPDRATALTDPTESGFWALSGVFLEPSFPRPTTDLARAIPHVVDFTRTTSVASDVGTRDIASFTGTTDVEEDVHFLIRRVRRWHEAQQEIASNIQALQYGYEMRRGVVDGYVPATRTFTATAPGTNLGALNDPLVNVNAGDVLRILNSTGDLIDQAEVQVVTGSTTLITRKPGLTVTIPPGATFELYLEQPLVPHEQSNQQLYDLVTDKVVFKRIVDYAAGGTEGGQVTAGFNKMQDDTVGFDFEQAGAQEGDYVIIDPAGTLYEAEEAGSRPIGDTAVFGRTPYVASKPNDLDDNRGFYKITARSGGELEVDGGSRFGGFEEDGSDDVIFGTPAVPNAQYVVLPTIHGSSIGTVTVDGVREGQQSLRPTAARVGTSFKGRAPGVDLSSSIQPFGYTIIRPSNIFSEDALELVFFIRERMLSLIEEVQSVYVNGKGGDYYVFQRDDHIEDVGSPNDPNDGQGLVSNNLITSLQGLVDEKPYANVEDCLSVLGRRFWILDFRLDEDGYTSFVEDDFDQRPVLPDLIDDVLNLDDRFRDLRFSWIRFRADRVNGSITEARRAEAALPDELQKQQDLIDQKKALAESGDS